MHISQQITALRKEGNLDEAEKLASSEFDENLDNKFFQSAYGWVIYFRLKNIPEDLQANKITHGKTISLLNYYINLYAKLDLIDRPDNQSNTPDIQLDRPDNQSNRPEIQPYRLDNKPNAPDIQLDRPNNQLNRPDNQPNRPDNQPNAPSP